MSEIGMLRQSHDPLSTSVDRRSNAADNDDARSRPQFRSGGALPIERVRLPHSCPYVLMLLANVALYAKTGRF